MNAQEIKQTKKEVVKKDFEFIKLSELTGKELKDQGFEMVKVIFNKKPTKNDYRYSIEIVINDDFLKVQLRPGGEYLTPDRFNLIALQLDLPIKDRMNRLNEKWVMTLPVRFIKGKFKNDTEYKSLEILFKQYLYDTHFFTSDQNRIIDTLEDKKNVKINWIERPEKIDTIEFDSTFSFN